jgi:long-chain acyl-CoA synthetase
MSELQANTLLVERVAQDPEARLFAIPDSFGGWFDLSAAEFHDRVRALAKGFVASGIGHGDRVGVLCSNRFEASLIDFATALIGVAVVPVAQDASQDDLQAILEDAGVVAMIVETARDFARFDELHGDLPEVAEVWQVALNGLDKLVLAGRGVSDATLSARAAAVTGETALAEYFVPEGDGFRRVTINHEALVSRARALAEVLESAAGEGHSTLLVLPAVDVTARLVTLVAVATGTRLGHLADPARLLDTLASFRPTLLVAPPSVFETIDKAAQERAQAVGRGPALRQALDVAVEYARALDEEVVPRGLKARFALADAIVLRGLRKAAGGRLVDVVSLAGPAALSERLRYLMRALDVRPLEAFGSTQTGGVALIERYTDPFERSTGTVGRPLAGVEVAVGQDDGLLVRGSGVAAGSQAAAGRGGVAAGSGAWLETGLEASVDDAGRVTLALSDVVEPLPVASDASAE